LKLEGYISILKSSNFISKTTELRTFAQEMHISKNPKFLIFLPNSMQETRNPIDNLNQKKNIT